MTDEDAVSVAEGWFAMAESLHRAAEAVGKLENVLAEAGLDDLADAIGDEP